MTARTALAIAAVLMFLAVACGAFGAHALRNRLAPEALAVWNTAVQYHAWHGLALLGVGSWLARTPDVPLLAWAGWLFVGGIVLFSGSLYALAFAGIKGLGAITPLGGLAFLAGWLALAVAAWRSG
jgi:uncharacterized membrane protein YgdD (TMEM256/DUF423 family)